MALGTGGGAGVGYGQGGQVGQFPQTGGNVRETREERIKREENEARLNDPYGLRQPTNPNTPQTDGTTRVVRKKVRVRRNNGQSDSTQGTNNSNGSNGTGQTGSRYSQQGPNSLLNRQWTGQASLVRASVLHQNNQQQQTANNNAVQQRNVMLGGLQQYIKNDYNMMKLNSADKAFTYRTAEARQLDATIGQMIASTSRQSTGNTKSTGSGGTTNTDSTSSRISPEAYGRQKTLLRRLAAMSDPNPKMPDNLPTDYRPFESVA
jgi:hypothetical protein